MKVGETTAATYTDKGLTTGKTYSYKVRAYNEYEYDGRESKVYGEYSAERAGKAVLGKVKSISLKKSSKKVTVKWSKVDGATGYQVYRSIKKTSGFKCVKTVTNGKTVKYVNKNLSKGKTYYYKVRAYRTIDSSKVYGSFTSVKSVKTPAK